jgi:hypothetical protein
MTLGPGASRNSSMCYSYLRLCRLGGRAGRSAVIRVVNESKHVLHRLPVDRLRDRPDSQEKSPFSPAHRVFEAGRVRPWW